MEGGRNKSPQASTDDEVDSSDRANGIDPGTGRFYECIFCKRGFSTAQALGGHMNIHRKDRARMRREPAVPPTGSRRATEEDTVGYAHPSGHRMFYPSVSESLRSYPVYFPASTSGAREAQAVYGEDGGGVGSRRPRELSLFGEELQLGLDMHVDGSRVRYDHEEKKEEEEAELDLELRLGHEP